MRFADHEERFSALVMAVVEELATPAELSEFQALLRAYPEFKLQYLEQIRIHGLMRYRCQMAEAARGLARPHPALNHPAVPAAPAAAPRLLFPITFRKIAIAVAASLLAVCTLWLAQRQMKSLHVARQAPASARYVQVIHQRDAEGLVVPEHLPGALRLAAGEATARLSSGVVLTLQGPLDLEVRDAMQVRLQRGRILAEVPPEASGFTVRTPELELWDIGTVFGVAVSSDFSDVFVLKGEVQVNEASGETVDLCCAGEGVRACRGQKQPIKYAADCPEAEKLLAGIRDFGACRDPKKVFETVAQIADLWIDRYLPEDLARQHFVRYYANTDNGGSQKSQSVIGMTKRITATLFEALKPKQEDAMKLSHQSLVAATASVLCGALSSSVYAETNTLVETFDEFHVGGLFPNNYPLLEGQFVYKQVGTTVSNAVVAQSGSDRAVQFWCTNTAESAMFVSAATYAAGTDTWQFTMDGAVVNSDKGSGYALTLSLMSDTVTGQITVTDFLNKIGLGVSFYRASSGTLRRIFWRRNTNGTSTGRQFWNGVAWTTSTVNYGTWNEGDEYRFALALTLTDIAVTLTNLTSGGTALTVSTPLSEISANTASLRLVAGDICNGNGGCVSTIDNIPGLCATQPGIVESFDAFATGSTVANAERLLGQYTLVQTGAATNGVVVQSGADKAWRLSTGANADLLYLKSGGLPAGSATRRFGFRFKATPPEFIQTIPIVALADAVAIDAAGCTATTYLNRSVFALEFLYNPDTAPNDKRIYVRRNIDATSGGRQTWSGAAWITGTGTICGNWRPGDDYEVFMDLSTTQITFRMVNRNTPDLPISASVSLAEVSANSTNFRFLLGDFEERGGNAVLEVDDLVGARSKGTLISIN